MPLYPFNPDPNQPRVNPTVLPTLVTPGDIPRPPLPGGPATSQPCDRDVDVSSDSSREPWIYPPWESQDFSQVASIATPAVGASTPVGSWTVPDGWDGIIRRMQMCYTGTAFEPGSGDIIWRLLINGRPVNYYGNVIVQIGTLTTPDKLDFGIPVRSGSVVSWEVQLFNGLLVPGTRIVCSAWGWFWKIARAGYR